MEHVRHNSSTSTKPSVPAPPKKRSTPYTSGELVLIRGLPGSGKSTMAEVLAQVGYEHFEADMYFLREVFQLPTARRALQRTSANPPPTAGMATLQVTVTGISNVTAHKQTQIARRHPDGAESSAAREYRGLVLPYVESAVKLTQLRAPKKRFLYRQFWDCRVDDNLFLEAEKC